MLSAACVTHRPTRRTVFETFFWLELMTLACFISGRTAAMQYKVLWFVASWVVTLPIMLVGYYSWPQGAVAQVAAHARRITRHFVVISVIYSVAWLLSDTEGLKLVPRCVEPLMYALCDVYTKTGFVGLTLFDPAPTLPVTHCEETATRTRGAHGGLVPPEPREHGR